jgi:hypothetical protein
MNAEPTWVMDIPRLRLQHEKRARAIHRRNILKRLFERRFVQDRIESARYTRDEHRPPDGAGRTATPRAAGGSTHF